MTDTEPIAEGSYEWYRREVEQLRAELEKTRTDREEEARVARSLRAALDQARDERDDVLAKVEQLRARVAELETTPVDWDAQRRRADELEGTVERLRAELAEARTSLENMTKIRNGFEATSRVHKLRATRWKARTERYRLAWQSARKRAKTYAKINDDYWRQLGIVGDKAIAEHERADQAEAERDAIAALMERMPDTHARFSVVGSDEPPKCADWCDVCRRERIEAERDAAHAAIDDTLRRMNQLRSWAFRDLSEEGLKNVLVVITHVLDCLDPDRTRGAALDASSAPESPTDAPTAPTRPGAREDA